MEPSTQRSIKRLSVAILVIGAIALVWNCLQMYFQIASDNNIHPVIWNPEIRGWQIFILAARYVGLTLLYLVCCLFLYRTNRGLKEGQVFPKSNIPLIRWSALVAALFAFADTNYDAVVRGESVLMLDAGTFLFPLLVLLFAGLYKMAALAAEDSSLAI